MKEVSMSKKLKKYIFKGTIVFYSLCSTGCSSTVEFLPEPDFRSEYLQYQKQNFSEVEVLYYKPEKPFLICGQILIRNFQGEINQKKIEILLQKESFEKKLDGVWILSSKREEIPPTLILGKNQNGMITNYHEIGKEVAKIQAIGFRYK